MSVIDQKRLKEFLGRRHPEYETLLPHWQFVELCYDGGRGWFENNIFRYIKEGEGEYKARLVRAYRFNHTKEVVDLVDKYLFKMQIHRRDEDAPESVKRFWSNATQNGLTIDDLMRRVSNRTSTFGRVWIVVDSSNRGEVSTLAEEKAVDARAYAYIVDPKNVLDLSVDEAGKLNWILIHETVRDDEDPILSSGKIESRYRLWERNQWTLFNVKKKGNQVTVEVDGPFAHDLGEVPVIAADCTISDNTYSSPSLVDDIAYLDRACANYLSNLDAIIQDQTFSQLAMPAQNIMPGEEAYDKVVEMGTKRVFLYDGEGGSGPQYISPDVKQAELILKVINKIINEIYHTVGLAGERTKEDNAQGIDNSSGVAKAYDFERVNSLLASKADSLEVVENKIARLVSLWHGEAVEDNVNLVEYPDTFDVRGLYDEFEIAARLALVDAPDGVRRHQMLSVIDKLFPMLAKDLKSKMQTELEQWPPVIDLAAATGQAGSSGAGLDAIKSKSNNALANTLVKEGG